MVLTFELNICTMNVPPAYKGKDLQDVQMIHNRWLSLDRCGGVQCLLATQEKSGGGVKAGRRSQSLSSSP